jgi:hypothetical protein
LGKQRKPKIVDAEQKRRVSSGSKELKAKRVLAALLVQIKTVAGARNWLVPYGII